MNQTHKNTSVHTALRWRQLKSSVWLNINNIINNTAMNRNVPDFKINKHNIIHTHRNTYDDKVCVLRYNNSVVYLLACVTREFVGRCRLPTGHNNNIVIMFKTQTPDALSTFGKIKFDLKIGILTRTAERRL